jgi:hypothetical protein
VINELVDATAVRVDQVAAASVGGSYVVYTIVATFGYLSFGANTEGNLFNSYSHSDLLINIMRCLFALTVVLTFPLMVMPCRRAIDSLLFFSRPYSYRRLMVAAACVIVLALAVAIVVPDVAMVFDITGSTAAMLTTYVLPAVFFLKVHSNLGLKPKLAEKIGAIGMICIGLVMYVPRDCICRSRTLIRERTGASLRYRSPFTPLQRLLDPDRACSSNDENSHRHVGGKLGGNKQHKKKSSQSALLNERCLLLAHNGLTGLARISGLRLPVSNGVSQTIVENK